MNTVRLPIFDEDGCGTMSYLEIDVANILSKYGTNARVVDSFEQNLRALGIIMPEEIETLQTAEDAPESTPVVEEWRSIGMLPTNQLLINRKGYIRHKSMQKPIEPVFDIDSNMYRTIVTLNGREYSLFGKSIADQMWAEDAT